MMKFIRDKGAAGRLPEKENRKGTLRGIPGLALALALGAVLAAGGMGTRAYAWNLDPPGIEENGELVTFPSISGKENETEAAGGNKWASGLEEGTTLAILSDGPSKISSGGESSELQDFLTAVTIIDKDGKEVPQDGGLLYVGDQYYISLVFTEKGPTNLQFDTSGTLTYQIPKNFQVDPQSGRTLKVYINGEPVEIGIYSIDGNGLLTVTLSDEGKARLKEVEDGQITFEMDATAQTAEGSTDGKVHFDDVGTSFGYTIVDQPRVNVEKTGKYTENAEKTGGSLEYTVTTKVEHGEVYDVKIEDVLTPPQTQALELEMGTADGESSVTVKVKRNGIDGEVTLKEGVDYELVPVDDPEHPNDKAFRVELKEDSSYNPLEEGDELYVTYNYNVEYVPGSTDMFWGNVVNEATITGTMQVTNPDDPDNPTTAGFGQKAGSNVEIYAVPPGDGIVFKDESYSESTKTLHYTLYTLVPAVKEEEEWSPFHIYDDMVVEYNGKKWYLPEFKKGQEGEKGSCRVKNLKVWAMDSDDLGWGDDTSDAQKIGDLKKLKEEIEKADPLQGYILGGDLSRYDSDSVDNYVYHYTDKSLYIFFGATQEELKAENYDEMWGKWGHWKHPKNRLIVTEYDLDMSDVTKEDKITLTEMNGSEKLELSPDEVLLAGIRNNVNLRFNNYNPGYSVFFNNKEKINKTGKLNKNDNTIDYTVTMNTTDSTVWGYFADVKKDLEAQVEEADGWNASIYYPKCMQAVFYDVLPDGWDYVEGSLSVTTQDANKNEHYFVYAAAEVAKYKDAPLVQEEEGKQVIIAPLIFFFEPSRLEGKPGLELFNTFGSTLAQITFTYKLKATEEWLKEHINDEYVPVKNHVEIKDRYRTHWERDAEVTYIPAKLTKTAEQVEKGSNRLKFTLQVNPKGEMLAQDQESSSGEKLNTQSYLIVTDKSTNLEILEGTITVKKKEEGGLADLNNIGAITTDKLKEIEAGKGWPADQWGQLPTEEESQFFRIVVPNGVPLTIQYEALVPTLGNSVQVSNEAGIEGIATSNVGYDQSLKVSHIDAGGSGSTYKLTIEKVDSENEAKGLAGAKFRFYIVIPEKESEKEKSILLENEEETEVSIKTKQIKIGEKTYNCQTASNWTFETGEDGRFTMENDPGKNLYWSLYPGYYYVLVEEEAPLGYNKLKEPLLFYYGTTDGENFGLYSDAELVLPNTDYVWKIKNEPAPYELPETGGFGTAYLYLMGSAFVLMGGAFLLYDRRLAHRRAGR